MDDEERKEGMNERKWRKKRRKDEMKEVSN